jgi:hypothetical protein
VGTTGWLGFDKKLRVTETVVDPGEEVFVRGEITSFDGTKMFTSGGIMSPLLVSHKSEEGLLSSLYRNVATTIILTVVIGGAILLFLYFRQNQ